MTTITVKTFSGVSPKTPARYLQDTQAQVALNCPVWLGSLKGLPGTSKIKDVVRSGEIKTIYRFGQDLNSATDHWFEFTTHTDVVRGAVAGDTEERTYWTDGVKPKKANSVKALTGGAPYPAASFDLGVPAPTVEPTLVVSGTATSAPQDRVYTFRFVSSWNEPSQPSPPSNVVSIGEGQTVTLTMAAIPSGNHSISTREIYRSVSGEGESEWLLVAAGIPAAQLTYADSVPDDQLGDALDSTDWEVPPNAMHSLVTMPNGMMAGATGKDVWLCDPMHPFAWSLAFTVPYPVVALGAMDTTLAVLTTGKPSFYQGSSPDSMVEVHTDITQSCVSKRSVVQMDGAVIYASPDGLVKLSPAGSGILTDPLFTKDLWKLFNPSSIHAYPWESKYVAFFSGATLPGMTQGGFVFDPAGGSFVYHDIYATAGYNDLQRDELYLVIGTEIHSWYTGTAKAYTWRSKKFEPPQPMCFSAAQVEAEAYPVTFKLYGDGVLVHTQTVTSRNGFRLPSGRYRDFEFEISGSGEVFSVSLAQSIRELANV